MKSRLQAPGRATPLPLLLGVLCWLVPGAWTGPGILVPSLFLPAAVRDSGWLGSSTLAVLAAYTAIAMGLPILMLYRLRMARTALTAVAAVFTAGVVSAAVASAATPEPLWAYLAVMAGTVLMWLPPSNRYLHTRVPHGNGAVL